jgi:hypothetical protein
MGELIDKIYNLYIAVLENLQIGGEMNQKDLSELLFLIHIVYFLEYGHPTELELLTIYDYYETAGAFLDDFSIDN